MNIAKISKTVMICASLLAMSIPCLAAEIPAPGQIEQKSQQPDAVVVSIDQNNVTLQGIADKDKKLTAPFTNAAEFKVGDKVIVAGTTLKKYDGNSQTDKVQPHAAVGTKASPTGKL